MQIYFVDGIRHDRFVQAETPEEAAKLVVKLNQIGDWEYPSVFLAEWKDGILTPTGEKLYEWPKEQEEEWNFQGFK